MKKIISGILICVLLLTFGLFALGSSSEDTGTVSQPEENVSDANGEKTETLDEKKNDNSLGDYVVEIKSYRLAKDYEKKPVIIITYSFTNDNNDTASAFFTAIEDTAYQNGVGLNEAIFVEDSYNYSSDNSTKEIKKGATIDVEVAYVLNDESTPVDGEVKEYFSFSDKVITKQFELK